MSHTADLLWYQGVLAIGRRAELVGCSMPIEDSTLQEPFLQLLRADDNLTLEVGGFVVLTPK